ncbi:hypothetical protein ACHAWU_007295 [Discostella pseudostelligera]|uniref:carnosine N-methyltransferase n=1 Tax=Discostella pseudostelligera TaxID=259834 RepID=A0ABD3M0T4_9STRA
MRRSAFAAIFFMIMTSISSPEATDEWKVPFVYYVPPHTSTSSDPGDAPHNNENNDQQPSFRELQTSLRYYREMAEGVIKKLSISHEVARRTEQLLFPHHDHSTCRSPERLQSSSFLSCRLEEKISKSAILLEKNSIVLERLLKPFPVIVGHSTIGSSSKTSENSNLFATSSSTNTQFTFPPSNNDSKTHQHSMQLTLTRYIPPYKPSQTNIDQDLDEATYDSASHILTHLVRDWTDSGKTIRTDTHNWILDQVFRLHGSCTSMDTDLELEPSHCTSTLSPVLVPGAGMARLAFDIAFARGDRSETSNIHYYPFTVQAVDNSIVMASAAFHILHFNYINDHDREHLEVFPFVADPYTNEVNSQLRWTSEIFPEDDVLEQFRHLHNQQSSNRPNLSYVIGDFVSVYASPSRHAMFGSIATCFFIDTATNIYEYILTIRNALRVGGVWINVGPVQWHRNAQLQPSVDELKEIISLCGFKIIHWEVSDKLLAYRHPNDILNGTRSEAYRPLKFVVVLQPDDCAHDEVKASDDEDLISSMEQLRQATGRRSIFTSTKIDETTS